MTDPRAELARHPTTFAWEFPPADRPALPSPLRRVNLRELMARPRRFEHHLTVVARVGCAQIEAVAASEPLYFAHVNISDEYAISLRTGDRMLEAVPFLTLLSDPETGEDLGRIKHKVGDMVLHPHGLLHWPGRLRPPYRTIEYPPGMRRTGLNVVFCGAEPRPPHPERLLFVSAGREDATKRYAATELPFVLAGLHDEAARTLARVGDASMSLLVDPQRIEAPRGAYVLVLEADAGPCFEGDLVYLPAGSELSGEGLRRALLVCAESPAQPPPEVWARVPEPAFAPFEEGERGELPVEVGELQIREQDGERVSVQLRGRSSSVPRYWLARFLFRVALHGYAIGYLETYGGLFYDDRDGTRRLGLRGVGSVVIGERELQASFERLYRAVAPAGYIERI